jgi:hypothetical protein
MLNAYAMWDPSNEAKKFLQVEFKHMNHCFTFWPDDGCMAETCSLVLLT